MLIWHDHYENHGHYKMFLEKMMMLLKAATAAVQKI